MSILIIAEHDNQSIKPVTLNLVTVAQQMGRDIDLLVAGEHAEPAAKAAAAIAGVRKVIHADHPAYAHQLAENMSKLVVDLAGEYGHILAPSTTAGKNMAPRVAALLGVNQISEIVSVESPDIFKRPIYAGNAIATVKSADPVKVITVRSTAFDPASPVGGDAIIEPCNRVHQHPDVSFVTEDLARTDRPELTSASVVVSGGRGMAHGDNFDLLFKVADKLGAAVGASRAAVDAGFVPNDMQVGQTGKMVAPDLYIAVGISGAIQHLAGMKDSRVIVAINKDEEAPIFQVADYGLVGDLFAAVPELESLL